MKAKRLTRDRSGVFYDHLRDGLTQGLLGSFLSCRQKATLVLEGLSPQSTRSYLDFGVLAHGCLEAMYNRTRALYPKPWIPKPDEIVSIITTQGDGWKADRKILTPESEQELELHLGLLEALLPAYVRFWTDDFSGAFQWLQVETQFRVPAPGHPELPLVGKIDGAFERGPKSLWLFETKTKSRITDGLEEALPLNIQVQFYLYALSQLTGRKPRGVLYNIVRRPGLKQRKDETLVQFLDRVKADVNSRPDFYFLRYECPVLEDEMAQFVRSLEVMVDEFIKWRKGELKTFMNGSSCMREFACTYLPVCSTGSRVGYQIRERVFMELEV